MPRLLLVIENESYVGFKTLSTGKGPIGKMPTDKVIMHIALKKATATAVLAIPTELRTLGQRQMHNDKTPPILEVDGLPLMVKSMMAQAPTNTELTKQTL